MTAFKNRKKERANSLIQTLQEKIWFVAPISSAPSGKMVRLETGRCFSAGYLTQ